MKILISNDDGYRARGILALREALVGLADLTVVAPDRNKSGASNSLTLDVPLRVTRSDDDCYVVTGTPTDCVHLAISGLFDFEHDMVVSGINDGENLGDDVLYSGTVAAAVEGRFLGLPTIAFSLQRPESGEADFSAAAKVARAMVAHLLAKPLDRSMILNVNVPHLPFEQLRGFRTTRLGHRHRAERGQESFGAADRLFVRRRRTQRDDCAVVVNRDLDRAKIADRVVPQIEIGIGVAQRLAQPRREPARDLVRRRAGRQADDEEHRLRGPGLRVGEAGAEERQEEEERAND